MVFHSWAGSRAVSPSLGDRRFRSLAVLPHGPGGDIKPPAAGWNLRRSARDLPVRCGAVAAPGGMPGVEPLVSVRPSGLGRVREFSGASKLARRWVI